MAHAVGETRRWRVPRTKFIAPPLPSYLVSRPSLLSKLDSRRDCPVTLVSAVAGSGKTVALAEWVSGRDVADTAWVSLDPGDNEDGRFWSVVLEALCGCAAIPGDSAVRRLVVPVNPSADSRFLAELVNALDELPRKVWLVLDDLHEVTHAEPLRGLTALLRYRPRGLRLVLSARHDPLLPFGRLRLADELAELRAEDLSFGPEEAGELLNAVGVDLDEEQLARLLAQTEGWAMGLRLAAVSLPDVADRDRFLDDFAAHDRSVAEYLVDEVLSRLPDNLCELLTSISVCDRVPVGLAAELSGQTDAGTLLDALTRRTSLVNRGDTAQRYQMHGLLRARLLADLERYHPDRASHLHGTAARWFARHDDPVRALSHAARTGDAELSGALAQRYAVGLLLGGDLELIQHLLDQLGNRAIAGDSFVALVSALLHLELGDPVLADRQLGAAEAAWPAEPSARLLALDQLVRSRRALVTGNVEDLLRYTEGFGDGADDALDALSRLHRGVASLVVGRLPAARAHLRAAAEFAGAGGHDYLETQCVAAFGVFAAVEGDFDRMAELAAEVRDRHRRHGWRHTIEEATASGLLGYAALLRADPHECLREVARSGALADVGNENLDLLGETLRGVAEFELGDWSGGARRVLRARMAAGEVRRSIHQVAMTAMLGHRMAVRLGWSAAAGHHLSWAEDVMPEAGEVHVMRARAYVALGRHDAAGKAVRPVLINAVPAVLPWTVIEAWLLACEAALGRGAEKQARLALKTALRMAQRLGVRYPVVFAQPDIVELMTGSLGLLGAVSDFARTMLAVRDSLRPPAMPAPFTPSERAILNLLPAFRSIDEIAMDLMVSPNTVKTHVRSIYHKLGVSRRSDAVEIASRRGLLEFGRPESHREVG